MKFRFIKARRLQFIQVLSDRFLLFLSRIKLRAHFRKQFIEISIAVKLDEFF